MRVDYSEQSLIGGRDENQDRCAAAVSEDAALLVVVDGMGGHADGARAAEIASKLIVETFWHTRQPILDPLGFLHLTIGAAHEAVVRLGARVPVEHKPRATCAVCLVQGSTAYWAHVGDSRVYHCRGRQLIERTRDHSHVEFLIREGVITADQAQAHPMRNYVECCLGGEPMLPEMSVVAGRRLQQGDTLLVCSDGVWGSLEIKDLVAGLEPAERPLRDNLTALLQKAVVANGPGSDNTSAAALRWLGAG
jgi:PPM family protein phosphatase